MENKVVEAEGRKTNRFRASEWPSDPAPVAGEPIVEYFTWRDLDTRGWPNGFIYWLLKSDGKRDVGAGVRNYYRVEQTERMRLALAPALALSGLNIRPANLDKAPLALKGYQLRNRGWTDAMIRRFLGDPDATQPRSWGASLEPLYAAQRVQQVEASEAFQEWWVRLQGSRARADEKARAEEKRIREEARRAAEDAESQNQWEEAQRLLAEREKLLAETEKLRVVFPGFRFSPELRGKRATATIRIGLYSGRSTSAEVSGEEVCALIREGNKTGDPKPLINWLFEHQVGNTRFKAALKFMVAGDPEGWRAWNGGAYGVAYPWEGDLGVAHPCPWEVDLANEEETIDLGV